MLWPILCLASPIVYWVKFEEALNALNQALRISPEDSVALNYLGMLFESLDRTQDAVVAYKRAIAAKPDYAEAHYNLALLFLLLRDRNQAQREYDLLRSLNSDLADTLLNKLGRIDP
jgi:Flp pilus assembly protein TadD